MPFFSAFQPVRKHCFFHEDDPGLILSAALCCMIDIAKQARIIHQQEGCQHIKYLLTFQIVIVADPADRVFPAVSMDCLLYTSPSPRDCS